MSFQTQRSRRGCRSRAAFAAAVFGLCACGPDPGSTPSAVTSVPAVSQPVDLQLQLLGAPNPSYTSEAITLTATVRNAGPLPATQLQLALMLPTTAQVQLQPEGPGWTCTQVAADGTASCASPSQDAMSETEVRLALLPNVSDGSITASGSLTSATPDSNPANNQATVIVPIMFDAQTYRAPAVAGGGFGCALSGDGGGFPLGSAASALTVLAALLLAQRRSARQPPRTGAAPRP